MTKKLKRIEKDDFVYEYIGDYDESECSYPKCYWCRRYLEIGYADIMNRLKRKGWLDKDFKHECCWCKLMRENLPPEIFKKYVSGMLDIHNTIVKEMVVFDPETEMSFNFYY